MVDLGAGTGALSRLLVDRADEVVAVEPDERMRAVLADEVPQIRVVDGRGEATGLPDDSADAVLASSSWHWMDPARALAEAARILVPGGTLGAVWSGPDPDGAFVAQARALLSRGAPTDGDGDRQSGGGGERGDGTRDGSDAELASVVNGDGNRPVSALEVPDGGPFLRPDHQVMRWDVALDADDIIGLLGTFSWVITMPEAARQRRLRPGPAAAARAPGRRGRRHGRRRLPGRVLENPLPPLRPISAGWLGDGPRRGKDGGP